MCINIVLYMKARGLGRDSIRRLHEEHALHQLHLRRRHGGRGVPRRGGEDSGVGAGALASVLVSFLPTRSTETCRSFCPRRLRLTRILCLLCQSYSFP